MEIVQNSHQSTSTTMWTQPKTEEQRRYYSKHAPKRKVYGWIMSLLQTAHGFLGFAAWTSVYIWVFKAVPQFLWLAPLLSISTLFALHVLFRTTWDTFWYDRLDDDDRTDSSIFIPAAILLLLLFAEVNGARMYLSNQVRPIEKQDASPIAATHATTIASLEQSYQNDKAEILALYKNKLVTATAGVDRKIRSAKSKGDPTGALQNERAKIAAPIDQAKTDALTKAFDRYQQSKANQDGRKESAEAIVDAQNANEVARYTSELGNVNTYAWVLSVCLLALIAALGYARVRINVMSGILPLRNYTVLDAHGSIIERFATAIGDIINRQSLRAAVWLHKAGSPSKALTSFDGTVVAKPGEYNTPAGFFPQQQGPTETELREKVFIKLAAAAKDGGIELTNEMLENELENAKSMNGKYLSTPLGKKNEPSAAQPAPATEGPSYPANEAPSYDAQLKAWAARVIHQVEAYDAAMAMDDLSRAKEHHSYITLKTNPIFKEAERLGITYGVVPGYPEIMVWHKETPDNKVGVSKLSENALKSPISIADEAPADGEDVDLFKQGLDLFKQSIEVQRDRDGKVIGVKYQKRSNDWVVYAMPQVEAFCRTYQARALKSRTLATRLGLAKWSYALSLFDTAGKNEHLEAIHL